MSSAINNYPLNAEHKAIGMQVLRESESPLISMLNTRLNAQVPAVQLNAPPEIWATVEQAPVSPRKSANSAKTLYEKVGSGICNTLRYMSQSPAELTRMCGVMMTLNMYEMMCEVAKYIGIGIDAYVEVVDVFTMTLLFRDLMLEQTKSKICKAFAIGHVV